LLDEFGARYVNAERVGAVDGGTYSMAGTGTG